MKPNEKVQMRASLVGVNIDEQVPSLTDDRNMMASNYL
jgi:hypothetical protein